jgi:hypothetical protein
MLIDFCVSNIPTYVMGFYLLFEGTHYNFQMVMLISTGMGPVARTDTT